MKNDILMARMKMRDDRHEPFFGCNPGTSHTNGTDVYSYQSCISDVSSLSINYLTQSAIEFKYANDDCYSRLQLFPPYARRNPLSNMHKLGICVIAAKDRSIKASWMVCCNSAISDGLRTNPDEALRVIFERSEYFKSGDSVDYAIRVASKGFLVQDPMTSNCHYCNIIITTNN